MLFEAEIRMPDGHTETIQFLAASPEAAEEMIERFILEQEQKSVA